MQHPAPTSSLGHAIAPTSTPGKSAGIVRVLAIATAIITVLGGGFALLAFASANGAPQEAAAAAFGCMIAVVPYVITRTVQIALGGN